MWLLFPRPAALFGLNENTIFHHNSKSFEEKSAETLTEPVETL